MRQYSLTHDFSRFWCSFLFCLSHVKTIIYQHYTDGGRHLLVPYKELELRHHCLLQSHHSCMQLKTESAMRLRATYSTSQTEHRQTFIITQVFHHITARLKCHISRKKRMSLTPSGLFYSKEVQIIHALKQSSNFLPKQRAEWLIPQLLPTRSFPRERGSWDYHSR